MNHAAMILAHKNTEQLIRLIKSISSKKVDVFVHLDSKMNVTDQEKKAIVNCAENVFIINDRINGILDTWTLVEATLRLVKFAKKIASEKNISYRYYILLSGQDYPIKSKDYILNYLNESYPKPLIDITPYDETNWVYHKFNTVAFYRCHNFINSKINPGILRKIIKLPIFIAEKFLSIIKKNMYKYFWSYNYKLYGGSAWWILPDKVIDFILNETNINSKKVCKLKRTVTPEETFFQIMTMASPLSDKVDVNPINMVAQNCMTYAHFSDEGKPFKGHPYILETDDYSKLIGKSQLFARKFDMDIDSKILDMLDESNQVIVNKKYLGK